MPQIRFTDRKIQSLRRRARGQVSYFDQREPGFGIRVGGTKTWFVKYVHRGRQRWVSLGQYPAMKLADARKAALAVKNAVAKGEDPAADRKAERQAHAESLSFLELAENFIEKHAKPKKRTWRDDQRMLLKHCRPWHGRRAAEITQANVVELLHEIATRGRRSVPEVVGKEKKGGSPIAANRVLACVRKAFNYTIKNPLPGRERITVNPAHMVDAPGRETERDRVYSEAETQRLWEAFSERGIAGAVYKVCLATGQRLNEVARIEWAEIDVDLWTLPGARTKNRRVHVVPLNDLALGILKDGRGLDDRYAFPSPVRPGQPFSSFGRPAANVRELSAVADFSAHDLRRTCETGITRLGFSRFIADRLLNHVDSGVGARYDRYEYLKEKREAAEAWGRWLARVVGEAQAVVQMVPRASGEETPGGVD